MTSRTTDAPDDEFDLTRFLWGDLPLVTEQPDPSPIGAPGDSPVSASPFFTTGEDRVVAETPAIQETSPPWETAAQRRPEHGAPDTAPHDAGDFIDAGDEFDSEPEIDLDALAALAELADASFAADDQTSADVPAENSASNEHAQLGMTGGYVKRAEQALLDALPNGEMRQALQRHWAAIESQDDSSVNTNASQATPDIPTLAPSRGQHLNGSQAQQVPPFNPLQQGQAARQHVGD